MPNPEKARLKAESARTIAADIEQALSNSEKNAIAITASRDALGRLLQRLSGYRTRIDQGLEEGKIPESSREAVYAVFKDMISVVADGVTAYKHEAENLKPYNAGIRKALSVAQDYARREEEIAVRAEELAEEEERERAKELAAAAEKAAAEEAAAQAPAQEQPAAESPAPVEAQAPVAVLGESLPEWLPDTPEVREAIAEAAVPPVPTEDPGAPSQVPKDRPKVKTRHGKNA